MLARKPSGVRLAGHNLMQTAGHLKLHGQLLKLQKLHCFMRLPGTCNAKCKDLWKHRLRLLSGNQLARGAACKEQWQYHFAIHIACRWSQQILDDCSNKLLECVHARHMLKVLMKR